MTNNIEEQLKCALTAEAGRTNHTNADRLRSLDRTTSRRSGRRRAIPALVAAAVVLLVGGIIGAMSVARQSTASPSATGRSSTGVVSTPTSGASTTGSDGTCGGPGAGSGKLPLTVGPSTGTATLYFSGGEPPNALLCTNLKFGGIDQAPNIGTFTSSGGAAYISGHIGYLTGDAGPSHSSDGLRTVVGAVDDTVSSVTVNDPGVTVALIPIGSGWRGFAIAVNSSLQVVTLTAKDVSGKVIDTKAFDAATAPPTTTPAKELCNSTGASPIKIPTISNGISATAILYFRQGTPPNAVLCSPYNFGGLDQVAGGLFPQESGPIWYLTSNIGSEGNAVSVIEVSGAVDSTVKSLTANVPGVNPTLVPMGSGWSGFAFGVSGSPSEVVLTAHDSTGKVIGTSTIDTSMNQFAISGPADPTSSAPASSDPATAAPDAMASCNSGSGNAVGISDAGPAGATVEFDVDSARHVICFSNSVDSTTTPIASAPIAAHGKTTIASGPGIWGAVNSSVATVRIFDKNSPSGRLVALNNLDAMNVFLEPVNGPATIKAFDAAGKLLEALPVG